MNKTIKYAGVAGILSLVLVVPVAIFESIRASNNLGDELVSLYIFTILISLMAYAFFIYGFKLVADKYSNNLLRISSCVLIISAIVYYGHFVLVLTYPNLDNIIIQVLSIMIFGGATIPFGIALLKLKPHFGSLATNAGTLEIISGASFLSFFLAFIGALLFVPIYILCSMILFRVAREIETTPSV